MPQQNASLQAAKDDNEALQSEVMRHPVFIRQRMEQRGKVYFMWDFVKNTWAMMEVLPRLAPGPERDEMLQDIAGRSAFAHILFTDTTGKLDMMTGNGGEEFSQDVKDKAKKASESAFAIQV